MQTFTELVSEKDEAMLSCEDLDTVQVNVGLRCNQSCRHCHVQASPERTEEMSRSTMDAILDALPLLGNNLVDITGGAPELNQKLPYFVEKIRAQDLQVQVRTNLTALQIPELSALAEFFRDHQVRLVASLPCYHRENVNAQRGSNCYEQSIACLKHLNQLGYGRNPALPLSLVYNPAGPLLPPSQQELEPEYRRILASEHGIEFTHLLTITNMPIGRFAEDLGPGLADYRSLIEGAFNPDTLPDLMCRHQISIAWDGTLHDCDFNLALGFPVDTKAAPDIRITDIEELRTRRIVMRRHCFGCTAGFGSSCGGALVNPEA